MAEKKTSTTKKPSGPTAKQKEMVSAGTAPTEKDANALVKAGLVDRATQMWDGSFQLVPSPKGKSL